MDSSPKEWTQPRGPGRRQAGGSGSPRKPRSPAQTAPSASGLGATCVTTSWEVGSSVGSPPGPRPSPRPPGPAAPGVCQGRGTGLCTWSLMPTDDDSLRRDNLAGPAHLQGQGVQGLLTAGQHERVGAGSHHGAWAGRPPLSLSSPAWALASPHLGLCSTGFCLLPQPWTRPSIVPSVMSR